MDAYVSPEPLPNVSPHGLPAKSKVTSVLAKAFDGKNSTAINSTKNENVIFFMLVIIVIASPAVDANNKLGKFLVLLDTCRRLTFFSS